MTAPDALLDRLRGVVDRLAGPGRRPAAPTRETPLSEGYWLESIDIFALIVACEREFGVAFDADEDFTPATFRTLGSLADAIDRKQRASQPRQDA